MKEITITNPAGITLNTKNTIVDDNIKIRLASGMFGNSEAKLVATGTWSINAHDEYCFKLDKSCEVNKIYLIVFYNLEEGFERLCILRTYNESGYMKSSYGIVTAVNSDNDNVVLCNCNLSSSEEGFDELYIRSFKNEDIYRDEEADYCEVYELPITLGGAE